MNKVVLLIVISYLTISLNMVAQGKSDDLQLDDMFEMSLEDLMNLEVKVGTISGTSNMKLPLSVTTIGKEEIELSNAQNILHLIQLYVPGASFWRHNEGAMIALRGITSDRNDKILLLVNGFVVNQKSHSGAITELQNWDMADISKIEIIRGPGSVTYGPGAIAGVINIITKSAGDLDGFKASASYASAYNNKTVSASYGFEKQKVSGYFHASVASTEGIVPDGKLLSGGSGNYFIASKGDSTGLNESYLAPAQTYMKDYEGQPQLKFLSSIKFLNENTLTVRYNRASYTTPGYLKSQSRKTLGFDESGERILGGYDDFFYSGQQQLIVSLKNNHSFEGAGIDLETEVGFVGGDYKRTIFEASAYRKEDFDLLSKDFDVNSFDFALNNRSNFSENTIVAKTMGIRKFSDKYKVAAGIEYNTTKYGKGWGDDERDLRMGDGSGIILNGTDSYYIHDINGRYSSVSLDRENLLYVGDGWRTDNLGFVAEANLSFTQLASVVLSARLDKNTYSDWLFSPRIAFVSEFNKNNIAKLVFQQSKRINNAEVLYINNKNGKENTDESISNIELIYTSLIGEHSMLNLSGYYNNQEAYGWHNLLRTTTKVASLKMAGFEFDYRLQFHDFRMGLNHSYNKLLDYKLENGALNAPTSFSKWLEPEALSGDLVDIGEGDDLRNVPNNITKVYLDKYFNNKKYVFHTEFAAIWGYPGNKDAQAIAAHQVSQEDAIGYYELYERAFDEHNLYGSNYFWNATVAGKIFEGAKLILGVNNILGGESTKSYNLGAPTKTAYFVEPRSYTAKLTYTF